MLACQSASSRILMHSLSISSRLALSLSLSTIVCPKSVRSRLCFPLAISSPPGTFWQEGDAERRKTLRCMVSLHVYINFLRLGPDILDIQLLSTCVIFSIPFGTCFLHVRLFRPTLTIALCKFVAFFSPATSACCPVTCNTAVDQFVSFKLVHAANGWWSGESAFPWCHNWC